MPTSIPEALRLIIDLKRGDRLRLGCADQAVAGLLLKAKSDAEGQSDRTGSDQDDLARMALTCALAKLSGGPAVYADLMSLDRLEEACSACLKASDGDGQSL